MLLNVFRKLDNFIELENQNRRDDGLFLLPKCELKLVGQMALFERNLQLNLIATVDVGAYYKMDYIIKKKLETLLKDEGLIFDEFSNEIWMHKETEYDDFFIGQWFSVLIAKPEYILISKIIKAKSKNKNLIISYLATTPSDLFLSLVEKYKISLEEFLL